MTSNSEKVIKIKISKFTLKLTNLRKLEKKDYAVFLVATILFMTIILFIVYIPCVLLLLYFCPSSVIFVLFYYIWIYFDFQELDKEIKPSTTPKYSVNYKILQAAAEYFPVRLIKTVDLPADKNYLLACYPHAVMSLHKIFNFSTNINEKDELYPGISMRLAVFSAFLYVPGVREYLLKIVNACSCSASTLKYILNSEPSKAVVLSPGSGLETCLSNAGDTYRIIKNRRKGFVRIALQTGASLVPVFVFGETNLWETFPLRGHGNPTYGLDAFTLKGRGFFQHHFGLLPRSVPINTVVGKPMPVPKVENPSSELIDEYHEKFFDALQGLFDEHKQQYDIAGENAKLVTI